MEHVVCMGEIRNAYKVFLRKGSLEQLQWTEE